MDPTKILQPDPPGASGGPPPVANAQDPLPEGNWLWRRVFVFALTIALITLIWFKIDSVADVARTGSETAIKGLVSMLRICLGLIGMLVLFYMLAPSAEQLTRMIQTASALKQGIAFRSTTTATAPDGSVATARTEAAPAPLQPEPTLTPTAAPTETGSPDNPPDDAAEPKAVLGKIAP